MAPVHSALRPMADRTSFFEHETWTAGVIGLGYVGLPLAVNAVQRGLRAIGFDVDAGGGGAPARRPLPGGGHLRRGAAGRRWPPAWR